MIETARQINLIYQFWIHTDAIRTIGPLEEVLNTPSHHRAHHGSNRRYLDRNHGSILIVWDRLFGTFQREHADDPVVYGLTTNIETFNPLAHRHPRVRRHRHRRRRRAHLGRPAVVTCCADRAGPTQRRPDRARRRGRTDRLLGGPGRLIAPVGGQARVGPVRDRRCHHLTHRQISFPGGTMPTDVVIVSAVRTPIATAYKGSLDRGRRLDASPRSPSAPPSERSGVPAELIEDIGFGESMQGGGNVGRYAANQLGMVAGARRGHPALVRLGHGGHPVDRREHRRRA